MERASQPAAPAPLPAPELDLLPAELEPPRIGLWLDRFRSRIAGFRPFAFDLRQAAVVGALSLWLVVALFFPETIPLYRIYIRNEKLAREIRQMESEIASLTREKERRLQLLDRMEWDAVYWEAMARETGLTREREHVVELARLTQGRARDSMQQRKPR